MGELLQAPGKVAMFRMFRMRRIRTSAFDGLIGQALIEAAPMDEPTPTATGEQSHLAAA